MFSNIFTYSIKPHTQKEIFEQNQNDLQSATDKLSKFLELDLEREMDEPDSNVMDIIQEVTHQAKYV